jgi:hypothetical protein
VKELFRTYLDETGLYQSEASLSQVDERREGRAASMARGRDITVSHKALNQTEYALERAMRTRGIAKEQSAKLVALYNHFKYYRQAIQSIDRFMTALVEGRIKPVKGQDQFAKFFIEIIGTCIHLIDGEVIRLYIHLSYGDPKLPRSIPAILAAKYWQPELEEAYMQMQVESYKQWRISTLTSPREWWDKVPDEQYFIESTAQYLQRDREEFRKSEIKHDYYRLPYIQVKQGESIFDRILPDLPPRILRTDEINSIKEICRNYFLKENVCYLIKETPILKLIDDLVEFCILLMKPENHIKVPSGQYVEKLVHIRPVHDMTDEMAQELTNLPRFIAYAKVIEEKEGKQNVFKGKMQTLKPVPVTEEKIETKHTFYHDGSCEITLDLRYKALKIDIESDTLRLGYCRERTQIEEEMKQRLMKWRSGQSNEPPPRSS